jgi:hypothetical protein
MLDRGEMTPVLFSRPLLDENFAGAVVVEDFKFIYVAWREEMGVSRCCVRE